MSFVPTIYLVTSGTSGDNDLDGVARYLRIEHSVQHRICHPETGQHPQNLRRRIASIIAEATEMCAPRIITSHDYFVIKLLYLASCRKEIKLEIWTEELGTPVKVDMCNTLVVAESIALYEEEVELAFS